MAKISKEEAVDRLVAEVERAEDYDLAEIYTELFPERATPAVVDKKAFARLLIEHIRRGIAAEEIVDLWNVVYPEYRHVWYDETENVLRYNEPELRYAK